MVEATREWPGRADGRKNRGIGSLCFAIPIKTASPDLREFFLTGLNMPHGMLLVGNWFYVATPIACTLPYRTGQTKIEGKGEKILDLPAGGHYTRNLIADRAGRKIYIAVGSASNVDEENGWERISDAPGFWKSIPTVAACGFSPPDCAIRLEWIGSRKRMSYGRSSTSAIFWATIWSPII